MTVLVCGECGAEVPPYYAYRERREYCSYRDNAERRHTKTVRLLCRDCVDVIARRDRGQLEPGAQGTLL